jgi:hypothetical protein
MEPIRGGFHVKTRADGKACIDVLAQLYNWRIVLAPTFPREHYLVDASFCYFGHGVDEHGVPRDMGQAFLNAVLAAEAWDGYGEPPGYDKRAL